jgi:DNA-binding transcriptional MerR regulator/SAM-dependent methyltransferase
MKIGEFVKRNQVSIDTIRHYVNLELLLPQKRNSQFEFDSRCQKDFEDILYLKALGFSLSDIKNIFMVKHLGRMTSFQQNDFYKDIFRGKLEDIDAEIDKLILEKNSLKNEIQSFDSVSDQNQFQIGINLNWLNLLQCHSCGKPLILEKAVINDDMVMEGKLKCKCGYGFDIHNGILYIDPCVHGRDQLPDIISYIQNTDDEYLEQVYKTLEWNYANIDFKDLENRIILELGSGSGFFLRRIYDELPESAIYIAVDFDPERMQFLKGIVEKAEIRKNVLFICCDFNQIPLHDHSVDVICDYTGTSNYGFDHREFLIRTLEQYFKNDATLIGSYMIFKNFSRNSSIPLACRQNFQMDTVKRHIRDLGFFTKAEYTSDEVTRGGIYESYFKSDEKILTYCFIGKRLG